jgi:hypothetical protein
MCASIIFDILNQELMSIKQFILYNINYLMKNKINISSVCHRSPSNAFVYIISSLVAYSLNQGKLLISFPFLIPI